MTSFDDDLRSAETELEHAKAHVYRVDGVIQYITRKMAEAATSEMPSPTGGETPPPLDS